MEFRVLLDAFEKERGWVNFQISSFNNFVDFGMQSIVDEIAEIKLMPELGDLKLILGKIEIDRPSIKEADGSTRIVYPNEARVRNLTYAAPVRITITPVVNGIQEKPEKVHIGNIPIMIKSRLCSTEGLSRKELIEKGEDPDDPGGYFIVNGTERVLVLIEEIANNKPILEKSKGLITTRINSERSGFKQRHLVERKPDGEITISFANLRKLPVTTLLKALGFETDKDICEHVSTNPAVLNELYINLFQDDATSTQEAIDIIGRKLRVDEDYRQERVNQILDRYLLPHLGQNREDREIKAEFLSKILKKIIMSSLKMIPTDDIDHYANKRLLMSGELISQLFRSILLGRWGLLAKMSYNYQKLVKRGKTPSIQGIIEADAVTKQILSSLATGNWIGGRSGVSQRLDRSSYVKTLSHLRSIVSPLTSTQEHFRARQIHPTEWGRLCPAETPEGASIGLRKHLALMAEITPGLSDEEETKVLKSLAIAGEAKSKKDSTDLYFNGKFVGSTPNPEAFVEGIRKKRRMGLITSQLNISYYKSFNEIRISSEHGRVRRPLIIVENGKPKLTDAIMTKLSTGKMTWDDLVKQGIIEYLDAKEEENTFIAIKPDVLAKDHTHLEVDPVVMLGLSATLISYPEYNRGDRINYGAKMIGQAIGIPVSNFNLRLETKFNTMIYPQAPLVETTTSRVLNEYPEGQNVVVAVMSYDGFNMNDAVIMNKSSVDRGLFRSFYYRTYEVLKKRYWGGQQDEILIPEPGIKGHRGEEAYQDLDEDGIINPETPVESDSVLVGKVSPLRFLSSEDFAADIENRRETSVTLRHGQKGVVDTIVISETADANHLVKVRIRDQRIPELGDKFASRHGQKGVVGLITPQEDMPFAGDGTVPDIIFNPHAIPSRMTIGQLLELLAGKAGAYTGQKINSSAFIHTTDDEIRKMMASLGFRDDGKQSLYDGRTGRKFDVLIFTGVSFYLKLDHMVSDKMHARSRGPVTLLTKQPTEGRAKRGGLRIGEMEQQCLVGHGAAVTLKERFDSDKAKFPICKKCGLIATYDVIKSRAYCSVCKNSEISWVETSYAFKLTLDEMKATGIYPSIETEEI